VGNINPEDEEIMLPRNISDYLPVVTTPFLISEDLHELQHHPDARASNVALNISPK
jgi:hypothetical protein